MTLLDTNTLIFYLKGQASVVLRLHSSSPGEVAIPSVVAYELEYGTLKSVSPKRREVVSELLSGLRQIPFDREAAREAARIRVELESGGLTIGPLDLMIAATAMSRSAVLVTSNTKEFSRVKGLRIADWSLAG